MTEELDIQSIKVGVVGLGLMGSSIVISLLLSGHPVIAIAPIPGEEEKALLDIRSQLNICERDGLISKPGNSYLPFLTISTDYQKLKDCALVIECVIETRDIKESVYQKIESSIHADAVIGSNTSALPISELQKYVANPQRFIGIHWAEPAFATRFMEIVCGSQTSVQTAEWVFKLAHYWGKEPTLLKKDIRGFVTNRLMYAVYREALDLVVNGHTTLEDADKSFRYDAGSWITMMGIFRRMDFLGVSDYSEMLSNILPELNNGDHVPPVMQQIVDNNATGIRNGVGLFKYTKEEATKWGEAFDSFSHDIYKLALMYPSKPIKVLYEDTIPE